MKTITIILRGFSILCVLPYLLLLRSDWAVQTPTEQGLLTPLLSPETFTSLYVAIWFFVIGYELVTLWRLLSSREWYPTFSLLLPIGFVRLYQYDPPFLGPSRLLCVGVLLVKLISILLLIWKVPREKRNGCIVWMSLEFLLLLRGFLTQFVFLRWPA